MPAVPTILSRRPSPGTLALAAGALVVLAALVLALRPQPVGVDVARIARGPMQVLVEEEGRTRVREVYTVSAPVTGRVLRPSLDVGDRVEKDTTEIAVIQPADPPFLDVRSRRETEAQVAAAAAGVDLAAAELKQAQAELDFAESELKRAERLARTSTIAERALQKAQIETETRRAAVARAQAQLELRRREHESARARLIGPSTPRQQPDTAGGCCVSVKAPASGRILKRLFESERVVATGTGLFEIGDTSDLEIVVELLSTDAVRITEGARVEVNGWGGRETLVGRVRRIEPGGFTKVSALGIEEQRVKTIVDLDRSAAAAALGHDFRVLTGIVVWQGERVLAVPVSALFRSGEAWAVFVAEGGRARLKTVGIGQRNADVAEVKSGLAEGDSVILHPGDRLADGVRIAPRDTAVPTRK